MRNGRLLVLAGVAQYIISMTILITASIYGENLPMWVKITDVGLVLTLVITSFFIRRAVPDEREVTISYTVATYFPVAIFLLMFLAADRLIWNTLLPGLAWRTWVLFYNLPSVIAVWRGAA